MRPPATSGLRGRSRGGFTLIEMVLVILIMGIIVALAVTRLDFMVPKYRLRSAVREVASVLKQGKARAAAQGKDCYFEANLSGGTYWLLAPFPKDSPGTEPPPPPLRPGECPPVESRAVEYQPVFLRTLPEGVHFVDAILGEREKWTTGLVRIRLSAFGAASHIILNFVNSDETVLALKMNGFTGIISYLEGHQDADELLEDSGT